MKSNTAVGKFKSGMDNGLLCANHHIDDLPFLFESYDSCVLLLGLVKEAASGLPQVKFEVVSGTKFLALT